MDFSPESYPLEVLARCRRSLYVSLLGRLLLLQSIVNSKSTLPVGNSSRLFTSSGVLSKDVAATGGRSGSVVVALSFEKPRLLGSRRADFRIWKIYSLSRVAALTAVIVNLVLFSLNSQVRCEVCSVVLPEIFVLTRHNPKLSVILVMVGAPACQVSMRESSQHPGLSSRSPHTLPSLLPPSCLCSACTSSAFQGHDPSPRSRCLWDSPASPFGTKIRWWWRLHP